MKDSEKILFRAMIRVVKSLSRPSEFMDFGAVNIVKEPIINASDKEEVKQFLANKYPQFFPNGNVYHRETKDQAQFFYIVIHELTAWEKRQINEGEWACSSCGHVHENKYISSPRMNRRLLGDQVLFCKSKDDVCYNHFISARNKNEAFPDDEYHVTSTSPNYIYKCTEKATGKCYIGKTRNAPFFRWWNHLTHSGSPFGLYLRSTELSDWTFEVLEVLPYNTPDTKILRIESEYMLKHNSIENGFNSVISYKKAALTEND